MGPVAFEEARVVTVLHSSSVLRPITYLPATHTPFLPPPLLRQYMLTINHRHPRHLDNVPLRMRHPPFLTLRTPLKVPHETLHPQYGAFQPSLPIIRACGLSELDIEAMRAVFDVCDFFASQVSVFEETAVLVVVEVEAEGFASFYALDFLVMCVPEEVVVRITSGSLSRFGEGRGGKVISDTHGSAALEVARAGALARGG